MRYVMLFLLIILVFTTGTYAQKGKFGSRDEAVAMVKRVQKMYVNQGAAETFRAVTSQRPEFKDRDLYPFIADFEGVNVAHGALKVLVGKYTLELRDGEGFALVKEMIKVARSTGKGWVDYKWPNPVTGKLTLKSAYIEKLGDDYFVGVGVHK